MSLFDVIKYPLSNPLKYSEIEALPKDIVIKWTDNYMAFRDTSYESRMSKLTRIHWDTDNFHAQQRLKDTILEHGDESI